MRFLHRHHHSWFPFILLGLTIALFFAFWVLVGDGGSRDFSEVEIVTDAFYEQGIQDSLHLFYEDGDASEAYGRIVDMTVPSGYKSLHLDLVLLFGHAAFEGGEIDNSDFVDLRSEYSWIP